MNFSSMVIIIREILIKISLKVSTISTCLLYGVCETPYRLLHVLNVFRPDSAVITVMSLAQSLEKPSDVYHFTHP